MPKASLGNDDIVRLFDLITQQLTEDRDSINDVFDELREMCRDEPMRFAEMGDTLAKMSELKMKQTAQIIEVMKTVDKAKPKEQEDYGPLTEEDRFAIEEAIRDEEKEGES